MKTYVIILAKQFPVGHRRAGEPTCFKEQLYNAVLPVAGVTACDCCDHATRNCDSCGYKIDNFRKKHHTIRANYPLWAKRIADIERGEACLSIRQWTDKPYRSKQVEIARLTKDVGVGVQKLSFSYEMGDFEADEKGYAIPIGRIAENDGLTLADWESWFKGYDITQPMAVIHFTPFRY